MAVSEQDGPWYEELDVADASHGKDTQRRGLVDVRKGDADCQVAGYQDARDADRLDADHQEADHHLDVATKRTQ